MNCGELFTRLTVWLAMGAYAVGAALLLRADGRPAWRRRARFWWTIGCALFVAHVVCAFTFFHGWSHADAYRETARQTGEMTGLHWGGGIFLNYLFAAAWVGDTLWWWLAPESFARRSRRLTALWHGFFFFMVFNGAVVFAAGPRRWIGAALCAGLVWLWWQARRRAIARKLPVL